MWHPQNFTTNLLIFVDVDFQSLQLSHPRKSDYIELKDLI